MEVIVEMKKYKLDVLGVGETKWRGNGAKNMDDCYMVYSERIHSNQEQLIRRLTM